MHEMNAYVCDDVLERLDDYLDQELTPAETHRVMEHLDGCMTCAARCERSYHELAILREVVQHVAAPASLMGAISRRLARRRSRKRDP